MEKTIENTLEVIYVDDENVNTYAFEGIFDDEFNIKTFNDATKAFVYIKESDNAAVVISDQSMPQMKGKELAEKIQKIKPYIKFIMISGNPDNEENLMYRTLKGNLFFDFLNKPVDFEKNCDQISGLIKNALHKAHDSYLKHEPEKIVGLLYDWPVHRFIDSITEFIRLFDSSNNLIVSFHLDHLKISKVNETDHSSEEIIRFTRIENSSWNLETISNEQTNAEGNAKDITDLFTFIINDPKYQHIKDMLNKPEVQQYKKAL